MRLLLDTHIILWAAFHADKLSIRARDLILEPGNSLCFSAASIWEVSIKSSLGRKDFTVDPHTLRQGLLQNGYQELPISAAHAAAVVDLPDIHGDPFDRILVSQSRCDGITLLTSDPKVAAYGPPVMQV